MGKSQGIDALKGALILWVVIGHVAEAAHVDHIAFWIGSGIRMPLLVGVSGYLLNRARVRSASLSDLASRYGRRLLLPWLVAGLVYLLMGGWTLDWRTPLQLVLRSPYHLWYIPVLCSLILVTRFVRLPPVGPMLLAAPVTLAALGGVLVPHGPVGEGSLAFDSRFLHYPFFFFLGMVLAARKSGPGLGWIALAPAGVGTLWWAGLHGVSDPVARTLAQFLMASGLIGLIPATAALRFAVPGLGAVGRASLFYYLWHPFVVGIALAREVPPAATVPLALLVLALTHRLLRRVPVAARWAGLPAPARSGQAERGLTAVPAPLVRQAADSPA